MKGGFLLERNGKIRGVHRHRLDKRRSIGGYAEVEAVDIENHIAIKGDVAIRCPGNERHSYEPCEKRAKNFFDIHDVCAERDFCLTAVRFVRARKPLNPLSMQD